MESFREFQAFLFYFSLIEWFAILSSLVYVFLATYGKMSAWFFGALGAFTYAYLSVEKQLYIDSLLQVIYLLFAVYGWFSWSKKGEEELVLVKWPLKNHALAVVVGSLLACLVGYLFDTFTRQFNPYMDAFITVFSLLATYLTAKKVVENWLYWIIINPFCAYLFYSRGLQPTAFLYGLYTLIAVVGYLKWKKEFRRQ
jgi:nicotinamide mononucleotide transporter